MTDITLAGITLPGDLFWSDEFTAWKVGQSQRRSLTGALVVQESAVQVGRPITLETTSNGNKYVAAIALPVLKQLQTLEAQTRTTPMTLVLPAHGSGTRSFDVLFDRAGGKALEARPLLYAVPYIDDDHFAITLRLITV
jgi:hypothetical protein